MQRKTIASVLLASVLTLCGSSLAGAQDRFHVLRLMTGAESFQMPFSGWLIEEGRGYSVTLTASPQMGEWLGESYLPKEDFWLAGGDLLSLELRPDDGSAATSHLLVLIAARPYVQQSLVEGFEDTGGSITGLDPAWELVGDETWLTADALSGQWSLVTRLSPAPGGSGLERLGTVTAGEPGGVDQVGVEAEVNPDPPGDGRLPGDSWSGEVTLTTLSLVEDSQPAVRVVMGFDDGVPALRAEADPQRTGCEICSTPWRPISWTEASRFSLTVGHDVQWHPAHLRPSLSFSVDTSSGEPTSDRLEDLALEVRELQAFGLGSFKVSPDLEGLELRLDSFERAIRRLDTSNHRAFQVDDFENGVIDDGWLLDGPVRLGTSAAAGAWQAEIDLADLAAADRGATLTAVLPYRRGSLSASFLLDLRQLDLEAEARLVTWTASSTADPKAGRLLWLELRGVDPGLQARAVAEDVRGDQHATPWLDVPEAVVPVAIRWHQGDRSAGSVTLWLGEQQGRILLDNRDQTIASVSYGVQDLAAPTLSPGVKMLGLDNLAIFD